MDILQRWRNIQKMEENGKYKKNTKENDAKDKEKKYKTFENKNGYNNNKEKP